MTRSTPELEVRVSDGEVTLAGHVNSRGEKRRVEDVAEGVSGVKNVQNNLRVGSTSGSDPEGRESNLRKSAHTSAGSTTGSRTASSDERAGRRSQGLRGASSGVRSVGAPELFRRRALLYSEPFGCGLTAR